MKTDYKDIKFKSNGKLKLLIIVNLSDTEDLVTVMWANESFDANKPDTFFEIV